MVNTYRDDPTRQELFLLPGETSCSLYRISNLLMTDFSYLELNNISSAGPSAESSQGHEHEAGRIPSGSCYLLDICACPPPSIFNYSSIALKISVAIP